MGPDHDYNGKCGAGEGVTKCRAVIVHVEMKFDKTWSSRKKFAQQPSSLGFFAKNFRASATMIRR